MWNADQIAIDVVEVENTVMVVRITMPTVTLEMIGDVSRDGRTLKVSGVHIQGASPGALQRSGLNAIGRALLRDADVDEIVIEGGARTTGRTAGRVPRTIRYPRDLRAPGGRGH